MIARLAIAVLLALAPPPAAAIEPERLTLRASICTPHSEEVVDGKVCRYRLDGELDLRVTARWWAQGRARLYGLQTWRPADEVGGGLGAWPGSRWNVERWQPVWAVRTGYRRGESSVFIEYRESPGVAVPEGRYHMNVGLEWRRDF